MRWRNYLAVLAALMVISWLRTIWEPSVVVALAVSVAIGLAGTLSLQMLRRRHLDHLAALSDEQRDIAIAELPEGDAAPARLDLGITYRPENLWQIPASRRFAYRAGSLSLHNFLFWMCSVVAGGIAVPLALRRMSPSDGPYVWLAVAGLFGLCAWGYRRMVTELGSYVLVDSQGIALEGTRRRDVRIGWLEIAWIRSVALPGETYRAVVIGSALGKRIVIDSQMPEYEVAVEMIAGKLVAIRGAA